MRASAAEKASSAAPSAGITTLLSSRDPATRYAVDLVDRPGGTQDIVGRDAALLAGEFVTPARSPDAFENSVTHERLQDRLQMARRQPVARRQGFGCDRTAPRVERDVDDGGNGQNTFARQKRHGSSAGRGGERRAVL